MAPHSSILAWRIPWTEEPGGLQSIGSQRVGPWPPLWPLLAQSWLSLGPAGSPPSVPGSPSDLSLKSANIFLASLGNKIVLNICIGLFCCPGLYRH